MVVFSQFLSLMMASFMFVCSSVWCTNKSSMLNRLGWGVSWFWVLCSCGHLSSMSLEEGLAVVECHDERQMWVSKWILFYRGMLLRRVYLPRGSTYIDWL
jgi:hypothetical protein